jgi:hypothetical protein
MPELLGCLAFLAVGLTIGMIAGYFHAKRMRLERAGDSFEAFAAPFEARGIPTVACGAVWDCFLRQWPWPPRSEDRLREFDPGDLDDLAFEIAAKCGVSSPKTASLLNWRGR